MADMSWDINGHDWAVDMLERHLSNGKLRHAYLFSGPDGVGRRTLALRFAQAVNCENPPAPGTACGKCRSCIQIYRMQHHDLAVVQPEDSAGMLKVEQVRDLQHYVSLMPYSSHYRIALLQDFEKANANGQNALLKTLEEPNPKVLILLTVDDAENLLPTIISRCELLRLRPMRITALTSLLMDQSNLSQENAALYARLAGGRVGYAYRFVEDTGILEKRDDWMADLRHLIRFDRSERISYSRKHTHNRYIHDRNTAKLQLSEAIPYWLSFWRDVLLTSTGSKTDITNIDMVSTMTEVANAIQPAEAEMAVRGLERAIARLQHANLQLMLDNLLMEWPIVDVEG